MKIRTLIIFFLAGISISGILAVLSSSPGYMDAEYYYLGGINLSQGNGFFEQILWNYLDSPAGLPHPSHLYWMPLPSILAAMGLLLGGKTVYFWARMPFIALCGLTPILSALLAYTSTASQRKAILAGLLALFSGFYAIFLNHTETFSPFMVLGGLFFLLIRDEVNNNPIKTLAGIFGLGVVSGCMHLTRADGIVWLVGGVIYLLLVCFINRQNPLSVRLKSLIIHSIVLVCGYGLIMAPWFIRNISLFGSPFSPGGNYSFWFVDYDDLYYYPASMLTASRWIESGISTILANRWTAFLQNLQTTIAVQGEIFLFPLIGIGLWNYRSKIKIQTAGFLWLATFGLMTVIFPFAGARGGFFHSGAAFQPLFWAMAAEGLDQIILWGVKKRNWVFNQAWKTFSIGFVAFSILLTGFLVYSRVIGPEYPTFKWDKDWNTYLDIEVQLKELKISDDAIIMINNPPGYFAANKRPCIVIPDGDINTVLTVARKYHASIIVLEENHPIGLDPIFNHPENVIKELERLPDNLDQITIYRINTDKET